METYSGIYNLFTWLHINSLTGLYIIGLFFSLFLRLLSPSKYTELSSSFEEYVDRCRIVCDKKRYKAAFIACLFIYGSFVKEFFMYDFVHLNDKGRREYVTEISRYRIYPFFNGRKKRVEMQSKYKAYQSFKKFYQREVIFIGSETTAEELDHFFSSRNCGVLKPDMSGCGKGVEIVRLADYNSKEEAFSFILSHRNHVLEEYVTEADFFRRLHPQSVNTVRIYACRLKEKTVIFGSHLRIGLDDSVVDNAAAGGVIVSLTNEGIAWTSGVDEFGNTYLFHPDSHVFIPGMKMPEWDKAVSLVEEAMLVFPDIRFVGWDLAYTDNGWIIIEANDNGQFHGYQIPYHHGCRKELENYIRSL